MIDSLQPHGEQHARFSCPSPSPGVCSNSIGNNKDLFNQFQNFALSLSKQKEETEQEEMIVLGKTNEESKSNVSKEYQLKKNIINSVLTCWSISQNCYECSST